MIDNLNEKRYDVIEINTKRIGVDKYNNEVIAIDLHTYERLKIEFKTRKSSFNIVRGKCEPMFQYGFKELPFESTQYKFKLEQNQEFIMGENDTFVTITKLSNSIK